MKHVYAHPNRVPATVDLMEITSTRWMITRVATRAGYRGEGYASRVLRRVCDDADTAGVTLVLTVSPDDDDTTDHLDFSQLREWYERYGFIADGLSSTMIRTPRAVDAMVTYGFCVSCGARNVEPCLVSCPSNDPTYFD